MQSYPTITIRHRGQIYGRPTILAEHTTALSSIIIRGSRILSCFTGGTRSHMATTTVQGVEHPGPTTV